jgi:hypothetical protein
MSFLNALKAKAQNAVTSKVQSSLTSVTSAVQTKATNVALNATASQIPGGSALVSVGKKMGISSATMLAIPTFFLTMSLQTKMLLGGAIFILILLIIALAVYFTSKTKSHFQNVADTISTQAVLINDKALALGQTVKGLAKMGTKEGFTNTQTVSHEIKLMNLQPLTVKDAGFLGPLTGGVFDEKAAVMNSLAAGARTFMLQIDYHEDEGKDSKLFPGVKEPCLLYRDDSGGLISLNAGSIERFTTALADTAFAHNTDPVILILYCLRAPDAITKPREYLAYCSKIAKQLAPLTQYHLGLTASGDYHRQALQSQLFTVPFTSFEKKVIIMSNMDTTLFRNTTSLQIPAYKSVEDLDYWTHVQLFRGETDIPLGITSVASQPTALLVSLKSVIGLTPADQAAWATKNKKTFTLVVPNQMTNPSYTDIDTLVNKMGVNVVPMDFFSFDVNDTKRLMAIWNKNTWNLRPHAIRV